MMTPEEKARQKIDQWFVDAGWDVVDREDYEPTSTAVAIREGVLKGNLEADYLLFINGKAIGVLEAKREDKDVSSDKVCEQAFLYAKSVPNTYQVYQNPLPFLFTSNGRELYFCDFRKQDYDFKQIITIPSPYELVKKLGVEDLFAGLPVLHKKGLRDCQYEAITELEKSFRSGQKRALMVLATGAGKTYTACLAAYRMLSYTPMRRILFLVDRNNLGKQAEGEFGTFRLTENGDAFNTIFTVNRLHSSSIPSDSNVVISTIQRLFSFLKGEAIVDDDYDDDNEPTEEVILPPNPNLPHDYFDMIIIDECHRSIYGNWRKVLEYFDTARLVGLTATPIEETMAFFDNNRIINYTLEKSIVDGVNVDCRVYRIKTEVTESGGAILEGEKVKEETRYTGEVKIINTKEPKTYTNKELNRSIINPAQIKLILSTYRDVVYTELFNEQQRDANFDYLPKTLIFALNETHATNIVQIAKEVFGRTDNRFVQKITYSTGDSNELIRQFRNDKDFRIAVTCTLVATGTDIKPLEVVMFMRDVESLPLYVQMKGRGVRTIGDEQLRNVTPNARSKDFFYLIDAVGVTEHEKGMPEPGGSTHPLPLKLLLERITHGYIPDEYLRQLAATLARVYNKADNSQRTKFARLAQEDMQVLATRIYNALSSETIPSLPPFNDVNEPNNERKQLVAPLANHADARQYLLELVAGYVDTLMPGEDTLIYKGFSIEEAKTTTEAFEEFCKEHTDEIEALRIIYNNEGEPITYSMLKDLEIKLKMANTHFISKRLWNSYAVLRPNNVRRITKEESEALTNIIQLVRFAFSQTERLDSAIATSKQYFSLWLGQTQRKLTEKQREIISRIVNYIASNGACTVRDIREDDATQAAQMIRAFGNMQKADEALQSLYTFVVLRKVA